MRVLKTAILKNYRTVNKRFWQTSIQGLPYIKTTALDLGWFTALLIS